MASSRTDLNPSESYTSYLILTVILVILSLAGGYLLYQHWLPSPTSQSTSLTPAATDVVPTTELPSPGAEVSTVSGLKLSPTIKPSITTKPSTTASPSATATPTPTTLTFSSDTDNFSVVYNSYRKFYQDTEFSGRRYTFYSPRGNIAVHVGTQWSWTHPDRLLNPTFVYETSSQKIIDMEKGDLKYTIQCVHNGIASLKTECDQFITDFQLL